MRDPTPIITNLEPEFGSIGAFVEFLLDDGRETFKPGEAQKIAGHIHRPIKEVMDELTRGYGLKVEIRSTHTPRGFTSNNHDLYSEKNGWRNGCGIGGTSRQMVSHYQPT